MDRAEEQLVREIIVRIFEKCIWKPKRDRQTETDRDTKTEEMETQRERERDANVCSCMYVCKQKSLIGITLHRG